jgi:uncharacterized membrane protein YbhN (UPF0104 family)
MIFSRKAKFYIKVLISLGLIAGLYCFVDRAKLVHTLLQFHLSSAILIVFLYAVGQLLSAIKWSLFVRSAGLKRSTIECLRAYLFGMFINVFGLGTVGGDVGRALALYPAKGERAKSFLTVICDRIHGLTVLLLIGTTMAFIVDLSPLGRLADVLRWGGAAGSVFALSFWLISPYFFDRVIKPGHKFSHAVEILPQVFSRSPLFLLKAGAISFAFHISQLLIHYVIAVEFASGLSASEIFALVPFANIVSTFPIAIMGGLGVREGMYTLLFCPFGVSREVAVAFGAVWLGTATLVGSCGAFFIPEDFATLKKRFKGEEITDL